MKILTLLSPCSAMGRRRKALTYTPSRVPAHIRRERAAERARAAAELARAAKPDNIVHVSSSEEEGDEEDEVYEVERILSHRMSKRYPVKCRSRRVMGIVFSTHCLL